MNSVNAVGGLSNERPTSFTDVDVVTAGFLEGISRDQFKTSSIEDGGIAVTQNDGSRGFIIFDGTTNINFLDAYHGALVHFGNRGLAIDYEFIDRKHGRAGFRWRKV